MPMWGKDRRECDSGKNRKNLSSAFGFWETKFGDGFGEMKSVREGEKKDAKKIES